jgi:hypothetical protein
MTVMGTDCVKTQNITSKSCRGDTQPAEWVNHQLLPLALNSSLVVVRRVDCDKYDVLTRFYSVN